MHRDALDFVVCIKDHCRLVMDTEHSHDEIDNGLLTCPQCNASYPIEYGVGVFLTRPTSTVESAMMESEIQARTRTYKKPVTRASQAERLPELDAMRTLLDACEGEAVLDAGCGRGAMLPLAVGATLYCGIDYTRQALDAYPPRTTDIDRIALFHGDVRQLPFGTGTFDSVFSSQVLEHLPSDDGRSQFLAELARVTKPDGRLVISVYNWNEGRKSKGIPKEGTHASGVFYHCYEPPELREHLARFFDVDKILGVGVTLPGTYRLSRTLGEYNRYWDRIWWKGFVGLKYGEILLARCYPKSH